MDVQSPHARPPDHQTQRRIRSVHAHAEVRVLPARTAHDPAPAGETVRLGREARGCSATHALFDLRQKAMHGARGAVDHAARVQIPLREWSNLGLHRPLSTWMFEVARAVWISSADRTDNH